MYVMLTVTFAVDEKIRTKVSMFIALRVIVYRRELHVGVELIVPTYTIFTATTLIAGVVPTEMLPMGLRYVLQVAGRSRQLWIFKDLVY